MLYVLEIREYNKADLIVSKSNHVAEGDGICGFDITTILGDILEDDPNGLFEFVKTHGGHNEHFDGIRKMLATFFYEGDFSVRKIESLMGLFRVPFPLKKGSLYTSNCNSLECVVLSVLHYLILEKYKFARCKHCGKIFATQTEKIVYCNRKSIFPGYERYSCKDAVKSIKDSLEKRRKRVYEHLRESQEMEIDYNKNRENGEPTGYATAAMVDFLDNCAAYKAEIKKNASVANIQAYSDYLANGNGFPKKYERVRG